MFSLVPVRRYQSKILRLAAILSVFLLILSYLRGSHDQQQPITRTARGWDVLTKSSIHKTDAIFPSNSSVPLTVTPGYIIQNSRVCSQFLTLTYLIVVHTAPNHFERRARLRRTWANQTLFKDMNSRVVFMLGSTPDWRLQRKIYLENNQFGDIVQGTFKDHYRNLTLKAVMSLRWISDHCRHADYVIKTDDDVFINIGRVVYDVFPVLAQRTREIVCSVEPHAYIFREGNPNPELTKWLMPEVYFKGLERYPMPFCYGYATFYPASLAVELYELAKSTPFYRLDDVYVYGILASKVKGLTWRNAGEAFFKTESETKVGVSKNYGQELLVGTATTDEDMNWLWRITKPL